MQTRKQAFRITALMAALLGVYGTAHAVDSSVVIETGSEASPYRLDSSVDYTAVHVKLGAYAVGAGVRINQTSAGPDKGNSVYALSAAGENSVISLEGGSVAATGAEYSRGILASTGATVNTNGTAISTVGYNSHAVYAWASAPGQSLVPKINVTGGTISTQGLMSRMVCIHIARAASMARKSISPPRARQVLAHSPKMGAPSAWMAPSSPPRAGFCRVRPSVVSACYPRTTAT